MSFLGSLVGDLAGAWFSSARSRSDARHQRDWEQMMSNTAVQRRKADLEAAGFNPMLSFMQEHAASTPPGASATAPSLHGAGSRAVTSALAAAERRNVEAQTRVTLAQEANVRADTDLKVATAAQAREQADVLYNTVPRLVAETKSFEASASRADAERALAEIRTEVEKLSVKEKEAVLKVLREKADAESRFWKSEYAQKYKLFLEDAMRGLGAATSAAGVVLGAKALKRFGHGRRPSR